MNDKEALEIYMKKRKCMDKCKIGCDFDCVKKKCEYDVSDADTAEAENNAIEALKYCVNNRINLVTRTEAENATETLKKYCNQHNGDCENCMFLMSDLSCGIKKMPFEYKEENWK